MGDEKTDEELASRIGTVSVAASGDDAVPASTVPFDAEPWARLRTARAPWSQN